MAKKTPPPSKTGRPAGSKNVQHVVDVQPGQCPACGSTRKEYTGSKNEQEFEGQVNGQAYNLIIRRRCVCSDCGQTRIERTFEFAPPAAREK
jgi:hypothetical protein